MSSDPALAIEVFGLGKRYRIGGPRERYGSLRDSISRAVTAPVRGLMRRGQTAEEEFWALRDVSFTVRTGEVLGIVGRNGAGKSTLLKILSRITDPSEGRAVVRGRIGSLLEVGTGFHPELTGRENIYLNGTILGMRREEIDRRFDEIVSFAGTEHFLDTPVKRYSSGMQVRLAFAVAAHIEAEILLVDEVLAVGDAEFQRKCLGKMRDVSRQGRTVLFVSHNLQAVKVLCQTALLLRAGKVVEYADVDSVLNAYISTGLTQPVNAEIRPEMRRVGTSDLDILRVELLNERDEPTATLLMDETFTVRITFRIHNSDQAYRVGFVIRDAYGQRLAYLVSSDQGMPHIRGEAGALYQVLARARNVFVPGSYTLDVNSKSMFDRYVSYVEGISFDIEPISVTREPRSSLGIVSLQATWSGPHKLPATGA